jgi:hypothetical protein
MSVVGTQIIHFLGHVRFPNHVCSTVSRIKIACVVSRYAEP